MRFKSGASLFVTLALALAIPGQIRGQPDSADTEGFGGNYSNLLPQQKRLIDDWFKRFSAVVGKPVSPAKGYETLPLSTKTTFNAVTHALVKSTLTDESGKSLGGSAIDLVDKLDSVAGEVIGERGDRQFRIYVQLKSGTAELLQQSKEFKRKADNTVYHKGYPICFRSAGGTPSIQVSLARDAARADIDVDYRSSTFPTSFVNGHLTASNSDVRAGANADKHNTQWAGLQNWWQNLLGLPTKPSPLLKMANGELGKQPKLKNAKPADAIYDFLNSWLVEQKPYESIASFAEQAWACAEFEQGRTIDRGMMKFAMLKQMLAVNDLFGKVSSLSEVSAGVDFSSERLKPINHAHRSEFTLYDVREDLAERLNCTNKLDPSQASSKASRSTAFGKYVAALFRIKYQNREGDVVATIWQNQRGYWKLISYEADPGISGNQVPSVGVQSAAEAPLEYIDGDKEMIKAASDFLNQWMVKKNIEKSMSYIAPECLACVNIYRPDDVPAVPSPAAARDLLKKGMAKAAEAVGPAKSLETVIIAADPHHRDLKLVKHSDEKAFVIVAVPQNMADAATCAQRKTDGEPDFHPASTTGYGKYFATGFSIDNGQKNASVLWIVWGKPNNSWKAVSYVLQAP